MRYAAFVAAVVHADPARPMRRRRRRSIRALRSAWSSNGSTIIGPSRTMPTSLRPCACCFTRRRSRSRRMPASISASSPVRSVQTLPKPSNSSPVSFPCRPEDEWVIVRAIAYSGLPDWRNILRRVAPRMPARRVMIDSYLAGTLPTLTDIPLEEAKPGHDGQAARRVHEESVCQGREEAEYDAHLRQQSGSAGYAVGILFRDRLARSDPAHHADAALEQKPRHRRQADGRQHGALHAGELRGPRRGLARISARRDLPGSRRRSRRRSPK